MTQPADDLGNAGNEALRRLFATPGFVKLGMPLQAVCQVASGKDKWVLVAVRGRNFASACLARDLWNLEVMEVLTESLEFYEVNVGNEYGLELAKSYRVEEENLPELFLVDPQTLHKELKIILCRQHPSIIDGTQVVEQILLFIDANGSPKQRTQRLLSEAHESVDDENAQLGERITSNHGSVVEVDLDSGEAFQRAKSVERKEKAPRPLPIEEITLDAWHQEVVSGVNCFKLRCRLPKSSLTLTLKPETPVRVLISFLAYRVYVEDTTSYDAPPPSLEIRAGFPPKMIPIPEPEEEGKEVTLMKWNGLKSGEMLTVHLRSDKS
ncbi:unnamed protein product [Phytomonas sp. Hart1]|nr:unnamed protein product [Phytomonas sp. Hart1]|eukprot:CCW67456.1 unnamed protein product [Phytomonas sp. isolate Hart1]